MKENDQILIVKYITGQATDDEVAAAKYLISSDKNCEEYYIQQYEARQKSILYDVDAIDTEKAYSAFLASSAGNVVLKPFVNLTKFAVAAVLLVALSFGI